MRQRYYHRPDGPYKEAAAKIQEVIVLIHGEAVKHGISQRAQFAPQSMHIEGDHLQLQQVVLNLTLNATQAMSGTKDTSY
jgi:C4-dicarboxylate-specific signal transduction histidine kinase